MPDHDDTVVQLDRSIEALIEGSSTDLDAVAQRVYRYQRSHCTAYARLCEQLGVGDVAGWRDVPSVPTEAFQRFDFRSFLPEDTRATFRTSGTTGDASGVHHFDTLNLYQKASLRAFGEAFGLTSERVRIVSLIPGVDQEPQSSLSQMIAWILEKWGRDDSVVDPTGACLVDGPTPTLILGTSLLLHSFFERNPDCSLAPEIGVMETGGFKGRGKELTRERLHRQYQRAGLDTSRVIGEYGMTELSSQWYDGRAGRAPESLQSRVYCPPPWARTRVVDPTTMGDVAMGETGILIHYDPINRGSILAIRTHDLGIRCEGESGRDGFQYLGRAVGARIRGCSQRYMEMLS